MRSASFATRSLGLTWLPLAVASCSPCSNDVVVRSLSPDAAMEAVVFLRGCGAPTPLGTHVSVGPPSPNVPDGDGNVFQALVRADTPSRAVDVELEWDGPDRLVVRYEGTAEVRWAVAIWGALHVDFVAMP